MGKWLDKRGPSVHHVAYLVDDVGEHAAELRGKGLEQIDMGPDPSAAFFYPRTTMGILTELVDAGTMQRLHDSTAPQQAFDPGPPNGARRIASRNSSSSAQQQEAALASPTATARAPPTPTSTAGSATATSERRGGRGQAPSGAVPMTWSRLERGVLVVGDAEQVAEDLPVELAEVGRPTGLGQRGVGETERLGEVVLDADVGALLGDEEARGRARCRSASSSGPLSTAPAGTPSAWRRCITSSACWSTVQRGDERVELGRRGQPTLGVGYGTAAVPSGGRSPTPAPATRRRRGRRRPTQRSSRHG